QAVEFGYSGYTDSAAARERQILVRGVCEDYVFDLLETEQGVKRLSDEFCLGNLIVGRERRRFLTDLIYTAGTRKQSRKKELLASTAEPVLKRLGIKVIEGGDYSRISGGRIIGNISLDNDLPEEMRGEIRRVFKQVDDYKEVLGIGIFVSRSRVVTPRLVWPGFEVKSLINGDKVPGFGIISKERIIEGLDEEIAKYNPVGRGLQQAINARKRVLLGNVRESVRTTGNSEVFEIMTKKDNRFPGPETGVYVIEQGNNLFTAYINPKAPSEQILEDLLNATARFSDSRVFEVPKEFLEIVRADEESGPIHAHCISIHAQKEGRLSF
ncbi:MAG: hypothetical protein KKB21_03410, partial [Nanoarchaeota archaeon]|nr:hypothetical protein [Nanoarchaeota archaeon]